MEEPNKIYVSLDIVRASIKPSIIHPSAEYISKDALLKWSRQAKEELENQNAIKEDIRKGAIYQLDELEEKLNTM